MMKRQNNPILPFLLALLLALSACFSACQTVPNEKTDGSDTSDASNDTAPDSLVLFDEGTYVTVVYNTTKFSKELRNKLTAGMRTALGSFPTLETDTKNPADTEVVEILLGSTNRVESNYIAEVGKTDGWFFVGIVGRKLVITACNDYMMEHAVDYFINEVLPTAEDGRLVFKKENNYLGIWKDFTVANWKLGRLPYYKGTTVSYSTTRFDSGTLITEKALADPASCEMVSVNRTNVDEFEAYLKRLGEYGFKELTRNTIESNIYVTLTRGEERVYTYFTAPQKSVTVILENGGATPAEISTPMTADPDKGAVFYQYGLRMHDGSEAGNGYSNNGMLYIIKCADNSLIIIDGGNPSSLSAAGEDGVAPHEKLNEFLHEITGAGEGEKITIACWFVTHGHSDHASAFPSFLKSYKEQYDLRSICANIPFPLMANEGVAGALSNFGSFVKKNYPDCKEVKVHTGQQFQFADVTVDILYTHEDAVSPAGISSFLSSDFNGSSTIAKFSAKGMSMLIVGDATSISEDEVMRMYSEEALRADIMQIAHHGFNSLPKLFEATQASYAFVPQSYGYFTDPPDYENGVHLSGMKGVKASLIKLVDNDKIFFAGDETYTVGLAYRNGQITVVHAPDTQHGLS